MKTTSKGIRKKENGKFIATKYINGKRHYSEFETEREAKKWKKEFHPLLSPQRSKTRHSLPISDQSNGKDKSIMFEDVLEDYQKEFLRSLTAYTQYKKMQRLQRFAPNIASVPMCVMSPEVITNHLDSVKLLIKKDSRRCNFDKELKDLASIFNWYKDNKDFTFVNPVSKIHYKLGKVADIPTKIKDMDMEEFVQFVDHLSPMFQSMAIIMLLWCLRVGEAAAITDDVLNLKKKEAWIFNVIVWFKGHPTPKKGTKTGADAKMPINDLIEVEIRKLQADRPKGCRYLFHYKGKLLRYDMILKEFNRALSEAELPYSGTHVIRHTMSTITRKNLGLDAAQAILRHTSSRMSEEYAKLDVDKKVLDVVTQASDLFKTVAKKATKGDQEDISS